MSTVFRITGLGSGIGAGGLHRVRFATQERRLVHIGRVRLLYSPRVATHRRLLEGSK
jgi:hypothetical protein